MVDTLHPFVQSIQDGLEKGLDEKTLLQEALEAARLGMENTRDMVAVKGRATYQGNKGVGHLDPGAVTLYYHIETLVNYIIEKEKKHE